MKLGSYAIEQDYSQYVLRASEIVYAVVGTATKGPVDTPTVCTSVPDLIRKFGNLSTDCLGLYAAQYFLNQGSRIYYVRAASKTAAPANTGSTLKFEAKYSGTYMNGYTLTVKEVKPVEEGEGETKKVVDYIFTLALRAPSNNKNPNKGTDLEVIKDISLNSLTKTITTKDADGKDVTSTVTLPESISSTYMTLVDVAANWTPVEGTVYKFSEGDNGVTGILPADYNRAGELLRSDNIDINLFAVPGVSDAAVITDMLTLAADRGDCLYLVDPPNHLDEDEVTKWHNGEGSGNSTKFDSSYGALYWSWQKIYDSTNAVYIEVPPSVVVAPVIARSVHMSEIWYAPAGLQRGLVRGVIEPVVAPDSGVRDALYTNNNINCIITDNQVGLCVFGQKTLQRQSTSLDRVNVRMLLNYLKKVIVAACRTLTFEPNDRYTWNAFEDLIEPTLQHIKNHRGVYEYRIVKGESIVTSDDIDNYRMPGMVLIKPTKAAEELPIYFTITSTGADFNEVLEANGVTVD